MKKYIWHTCQQGQYRADPIISRLLTDHGHWWPRGSPYTICLLFLLAKLATSHVLQGNKNKTYRGRGKRLSVSIDNHHHGSNSFYKWAFHGLFFFLSSFQYSWCQIKFSLDWIQTAYLLCQKRLLYQLSHNDCPAKKIVTTHRKTSKGHILIRWKRLLNFSTLVFEPISSYFWMKY